MRAQRHTSFEPWTWLKLQHGVYQHSLLSLYLRFPHLPPQHVVHNMIEDVCENMFVLDNMILFLQVNMYFRFWNSEFNILLDNKSEMNSGYVNMGWQHETIFSEDVVEIRQAKTRKKTTQKTTWPSTMLNCLARQQVSHSASTMVRQHWVSSSNQTLCQPNSTWSCTSTSTWWMTTSVQHVFTLVWQWRNVNNSGKPRFKHFPERRQLVSTDWQCHHQG